MKPHWVAVVGREGKEQWFRRCLSPDFRLSLVFLSLLPWQTQAASVPGLGAHALAYYRLGATNCVQISTPAIDTQPTGSTILACIGRGDFSAFSTLPTDNKGNTPYVRLGSAHPYTHWANSGTALYTFPAAVGGPGHVISAATPANDEVTMAVVEVRNGGVIVDTKWNEVLQGNPLTSQSVTTTGPATLVAFWWGGRGRAGVRRAGLAELAGAVPPSRRAAVHEDRREQQLQGRRGA